MFVAGLFIIEYTQENVLVIRKVTWLTMSKSSTWHNTKLKS